MAFSSRSKYPDGIRGESVILIGIGSNLSHPEAGPPKELCMAALAELEQRDITVERRSRWYASAPVPASDQPDFVNGVAAVATSRDPQELLAVLHDVEAMFGRTRSVANAARTLDLDLLAYHDLVRDFGSPPLVPHPRMRERAFVLLPLREIAPDWRHPADGRGIDDLVRQLPGDQICRPC